MHHSDSRNIAIIGGGLAGLSAAYDLVNSGFKVALFEQDKAFGGLASTFTAGDVEIERFYHFICKSDSHLIRLIEELGIESKLHWHRTHTGFFYNGRLYPFGRPLDLLRFAPVPFTQRIRFGIHVLWSRYRSKWRELDHIEAVPWLIRNIGKQAYDVIWHPLLKVKFGKRYREISAAWVWHRIWRVANSREKLLGPEAFGYLEHGSKMLTDALVDYLKAHPNAELYPHTRVIKIVRSEKRVEGVLVDQELIPFDAVLSTVPLPVLSNLVGDSDEPYFRKIGQIEYIGVVCAVFVLDRRFSRNFWLNTYDPRISFNGIIELTNLNRTIGGDDFHVVYVPFYISTDSERYLRNDEDLFDEYIKMLHVINPEFDGKWIKEGRIFRAKYAQAICHTDFASQIPGTRSPIRGLYVTDSTQFYPEDRSLSAAVKQGRLVAEEITRDFTG